MYIMIFSNAIKIVNLEDFINSIICLIFKNQIKSSCFVYYYIKTLKQFYIQSGLKYGSEFLVYEDDPNLVHSKYMVNSYYSSEKFSLVQAQRLARNTKKDLLVFIVDDSKAYKKDSNDCLETMVNKNKNENEFIKTLKHIFDAYQGKYNDGITIIKVNWIDIK